MPCILLDAAIVGGALMVALSLIGFTISTGIAPMPSSTAACRAMRAAVAAAPDGPVVDLGSGWGTLAISVARVDPGRRVIGYEVSWFPWLVSVALARVLRLSNVRFVRADFRGVALPWPAGSVLPVPGRHARCRAQVGDGDAAAPDPREQHLRAAFDAAAGDDPAR
jgi:hypothetical protein